MINIFKHKLLRVLTKDEHRSHKRDFLFISSQMSWFNKTVLKLRQRTLINECPLFHVDILKL